MTRNTITLVQESWKKVEAIAPQAVALVGAADYGTNKFSLLNLPRAATIEEKK